MSVELAESMPHTTTIKYHHFDLSRADGIFDGSQLPGGDDKWRDLLIPSTGDAGTEEHMPLDLGVLIRVLDEHSKEMKESQGGTSWEMILVQGFLVTLLLLISVAWACCCKRKCFDAAPPSVQSAIRKLSRVSTKSSLPPSYSTADLHTLAMSVQDYLYPPPDYKEIYRARSGDNLAYLDLEAGHARLARLSFSSDTPPSFSRTNSAGLETALIAGLEAVARKHSIQETPTTRKSSVNEKASTQQSSRKSSSSNSQQSSRKSSSNSSQQSSRRSSSSSSSSSSQLDSFTLSRTPLGFDSLSPRKGSLVLDPASPRRTADLQQTCSPVHGEPEANRRTSIIKDSASRKSSGLDSRKSSSSQGSRRISFSEDVEVSNGTVRKLSSPIEVSRKSSSSPSLSSSEASRKSSSTSEDDSRKSSVYFSRKIGLSQDALDQELRRKLEKLEQEELEEERQQQQQEQQQQQQQQQQHPLETVVEIEKY